ncbi:MAG: DegT/DnrJ/EryC1/StrS family aminotransferase [Sulfuricaulis sp.]
MPDAWREVPPTAGLPLRWRDFLPARTGAIETGLAALLRLPPVQIECSGTAALIVALSTLKQDSARRSVVIPAYTCPLVALAVLHCGLKPVLCDLRPDHFDMSPQALEIICNDDTLAVIPTHLGGRLADVASVNKIAQRVGANVIEDAAQSLGASMNGQAAGLLGDIGFYSLAVGKGLTLYEGGVLVTRDAVLRERLRASSTEIVPYRLSWEIRRLWQLAGYTALYRPSGLRLAYGAPLRRALRKGKLIEAVGDDFSADIPLHRVGGWRRSIGARALARLPSFLAMLSTQAAARKKRLAAIPGVAVMDDPEGARGTWPYLMVLMPSARSRDAALTHLWPAGLGVSRLFIHALPDYPYLAAQLGQADVPHARNFAARMLTVSNSPWLREADFLRIHAVLMQHT